MKKSFLILLLISLLLFVGCGKIQKEESTKKEDKIEKYSLVSSNDRLVFKSNDDYEIVYYKNGKIVKVETAIKFDTPEEASRHLREESYGRSRVMKTIYNVFIVEETNDYWADYKDLSADDLIKYMQNAENPYILCISA